MEHNLFALYLVLVPLLGVIAQWIAWKVKVPSILVLLAFGLIVGIWISPDEVLAETLGIEASAAPSLLFPLVSLSVAVILFEGGLTLRFSELRKTGSTVFRLITIGAALSMVLSAVAMHYTIGFSWPICWLLGAILMVTGPTVIGPLLRQIRPNEKVSSALKWEGILIDPIGAIAAVLVFEIISHLGSVPWPELAMSLTLTFLLGVGLGLLAAAVLVASLRYYWLPDYLHGVMFLSVSLAVFWLSNYLIEESGLVTVTILGIALANQRFVSVEHVLEFKEHLRVLLISCLFILLGSRLQISQLAEIGWNSVPLLLTLILVVRPISVWVSTIGSNMTWQEKLFIGLVSPRGIVAAAVSSVFGLKLVSLLANSEPQLELLAEARLLVPVTFIVIIGTVLFSGLVAPFLARKLGLAEADPQGVLFAGASPLVCEIAKALQKLKINVLLLDTNHRNISNARMGGLNAVCGNVLSEHFQEEIPLSGLGYFLAMTPNDEVNTLAVQEFRSIFGRATIYQLYPDGKLSGRFQKLPEHLRGRMLFADSMSFSKLNQLFDAGWQIKTPQITEEFSYGSFAATYNGRAIPMFRISAEDRLGIRSSVASFSPEAGDTLVALVPNIKNGEEIAANPENDQASDQTT